MTRHPDGYERDGKRYKRKSALIVDHARELVREDKPVTHAAIMAMLDEQRPGHRTYPTEISRALKRTVPKAKRVRSGQRVRVKGAVYPSVRSAARAEGVPMETARKRIANPNFPDWSKID